MSIHLALLTLSCCALAAATAGSQLAGLTEDAVRAQQMALLVSGALVAGNAACLLPDTPAWYSAALVSLTCAGLVWLAVSLVAARRGEARRGEARRARVTAGAMDRAPANPRPATPRTAAAPVLAAPTLTVVSAAGPRTPLDEATDDLPAARPHLALLPGGLAAAPQAAAEPPTYAVVQATPVADTPRHNPSDNPSEIRWDGDGNGTVLAAYLSERSLVTRADLNTIGSPGARAHNVEIARRIGSYAPEAARRRAAGSAFRQRAHALDGSVLRAQLRSAYEDTPPPRRTPDGQA